MPDVDRRVLCDEAERAQQVYRLADEARAQEITPAMAKDFTQEEWGNLAFLAKCIPPSPYVQVLVISVLHDLEDARINEAERIARIYYEAYQHEDKLTDGWGDLNSSHRQALTQATLDLLERGVIAVPRRH